MKLGICYMMFENDLVNVFSRLEEFYSVQLCDVAKWNIFWAYNFLKGFKNVSIDFSLTVS